jgi:hypothetical protein
MLVLAGLALAMITFGLIALVVVDAGHEPPGEPWDPWS